MALKQQFQQKLQQKLSPLQLQIIKLLEFSVLEFEEKIKTELEENPALEEGVSEEDVSDGEEELSDTETDELFDVADYMDDGDDADYSMPKDPNANSSGIYSIPQSEGESFHEHLLSQLNLLPISEQQFLLAEYVVGNIDEEGYLRREIAQIATDISIVTGTNITESALFEILAIVQQLEPSGVGARSLQECLLLQLQRKKITPSVDIAMRLLEEYFTEFSNKHYDKIMAKLEIDDDTLRAAIEEIVHLNPKPGNGWNGLLLEKNKEAITPDFVLESQEGQLSLSLNSNHIPSLRVNHVYVNLFQDFVSNKANQTQSMKDAVSFAKQKLDAAKSFIDAVKQREETLLKVTTAIVNFQRQYFYEGSDAFLRPMTMKDIAEISGYDISTISRVANSKYIQTNFGVFPLRYFFTEGMLTQSGEEVSTREIKNILVQCIEEEDKKKPLSDDKLTDILEGKGFNIARRTVAKYREQLEIPVARLRKSM